MAGLDAVFRDVQRVLTRAYALAKRKAGFGGRPVGVREGKLLASVDRLRVTIR